MSDANYQLFSDMKAFLAFDAADAENLGTLTDFVGDQGPEISEQFYTSLGAYPATAKIIEGRVDALKRTHLDWMLDLTNGEYDRGFFDRQFRIGEVHVAVGIEPAFVESVMSVMRQQFEVRLKVAFGADRGGELYRSLVKILDLSLMVINLSYQDERLARISGFTGMSRNLIENLVKKGKRSA